MNLKSFLYLALLDWKIEIEVNFFIREFLEDFYFPTDFIVVAENF